MELVEDSDRSEVLPPTVRHSVVQKSEDIIDFVTPVSLEGAISGQDVPLMTFKLTKIVKTAETVLGVSLNHIVGTSSYLAILNVAYLEMKRSQGMPEHYGRSC